MPVATAAVAVMGSAAGRSGSRPPPAWQPPQWIVPAASDAALDAGEARREGQGEGGALEGPTKEGGKGERRQRGTSVLEWRGRGGGGNEKQAFRGVATAGRLVGRTNVAPPLPPVPLPPSSSSLSLTWPHLPPSTGCCCGIGCG